MLNAYFNMSYTLFRTLAIKVIINMMFFRRLLLVLWVFTSSVYAEGEPLYVGVESFAPPFVMQGANKKIFGFDIEMMNSLCASIGRTCQFRVMRFDQLLPSLLSNDIDVAVSAITITADRAKIVNFSAPYSLSYSRFMTQKSNSAAAFNLDLLSEKKIGIESGTIFEKQINEMGVKKPVIKEYPKFEDLLESLNSGQVDYILIDNPAAIYWSANSPTLTVIGPSFMYGYGLGIAIRPGDNDLLSSINNALLQYQNSPAYKENYDKYLSQF